MNRFGTMLPSERTRLKITSVSDADTADLEAVQIFSVSKCFIVAAGAPDYRQHMLPYYLPSVCYLFGVIVKHSGVPSRASHHAKVQGFSPYELKKHFKIMCVYVEYMGMYSVCVCVYSNWVCVYVCVCRRCF